MDNFELTFPEADDRDYGGKIRFEWENDRRNGEITPVMTISTRPLDTDLDESTWWVGLDPDDILVLVKSLLDVRAEMIDRRAGLSPSQRGAS